MPSPIKVLNDSVISVARGYKKVRMNVSFVDVPCLWIPEAESFKKWYQLHCATFFIITVCLCTVSLFYSIFLLSCFFSFSHSLQYIHDISYYSIQEYRE